MGEMDGVIQEFLVESYENLDQLDRDFIELESNSACRENLARIFRTIHTIKGTCGFLGFRKLEGLTHAGENLLGLLGDARLQLTTEITSTLLTMVDAVRVYLGNIEKFNEEGAEDYSELIEVLDSLQSTSAETPALMLAPNGRDPLAIVAMEEAAAISPGNAAISQPTTVDHSAPLEMRTWKTDSTVRVDVGVLDRLMNLVGELVLARNHLLQLNAAKDAEPNASLTYATQRLNLITTELQEGVMKTRMQPIRNIWQKFPRLVRDLATACGKRAVLETQGEDTELDKTLIEAIKDPLTHLIRNAVDHGLERPEVRIARGKPAEGRLLLRAYHEGGQVSIEISDDGAGIRLDDVRRKAIQKNLINSAHAESMSERDALNLIFLPGFSTAAHVTNVSGRGVGMDVVRTNVEKIGGTIEIQSSEGSGTTVKMRVPLTLAIIPALIVRSGTDRFAIPQASLLELVRLEPEEARRSIETIHSTAVYRLRGNLIPIVHLGRELGTTSGNHLFDLLPQDAINIVVLQADAHPFGVVVDSIQNTEEIVVKPLGKQIKNIPAYAGATIMGDGKVALILDIQGLFRASGVTLEDAQALEPEQRTLREDRQLHLLICELRDGTRIALPVEAVERLEQFPASAVERIGNREVVQYRGEIMPLLDVALAIPGRGMPLTELSPEAQTSSEPGNSVSRNALPVLVHRSARHPVGLKVERILDVCRVASDELRPPQRPGTRGTIVIQGRVTELLDVTGLTDLVLPAQDHEVLSLPTGSHR